MPHKLAAQSTPPKKIAATLKCNGCTRAKVDLAIDYRFSDLLSQIMMITTNGTVTLADDTMRYQVLAILTGISNQQWRQAELEVALESRLSSRMRRTGAGRPRGAATAALSIPEESSLLDADAPEPVRAAAATAPASKPKTDLFPVVWSHAGVLYCLCSVSCILNCRASVIPRGDAKLLEFRQRPADSLSEAEVIAECGFVSWSSLISVEHLSAVHVDILRAEMGLSPRPSPVAFARFSLDQFRSVGAAPAASLLSRPFGHEIAENGQQLTLGDSLLNGMMTVNEMRAAISSMRNLYHQLDNTNIRQMMTVLGGQEENLRQMLLTKGVPEDQLGSIVGLCRRYGRHFPSVEAIRDEDIPQPTRAARSHVPSPSPESAEFSDEEQELAEIRRADPVAASPLVYPASTFPPQASPVSVMLAAPTPPSPARAPTPRRASPVVDTRSPARGSPRPEHFYTPINFLDLPMPDDYADFRTPSPEDLEPGDFYHPRGTDGIRYWEWGRIFLTLLIASLLGAAIWYFIKWMNFTCGTSDPTYALCTDPRLFNVTEATDDCTTLPGQIFDASCRQINHYINMFYFYQKRGVRQGMNISVADLDSALQMCRGTWGWGARAMQALRRCFPPATDIGQYLWSVTPGAEDVGQLLELMRQEVARRMGK